jgi:ABC-type enterochelin transport system permease subunit
MVNFATSVATVTILVRTMVTAITKHAIVTIGILAFLANKLPGTVKTFLGPKPK